jgi:hypothetical protein
MTVPQPQTALPPHVLERSDVREAIARHDFGALFTLARKWGGISYSKIGEACGIKPERVGTLARGEGSITTHEKIVQIADVMCIPGEMLGLASREWESARPRMTEFTSPHDGTALRLNGDETLLRRDFLRTSTLGAGLVLGLPALTTASGRRIGSDLPDQLRLRAARLRRLDDILGGGDTYKLYLNEYEATGALLRGGTYAEATGRALLSVMAETGTTGRMGRIRLRRPAQRQAALRSQPRGGRPSLRRAACRERPRIPCVPTDRRRPPGRSSDRRGSLPHCRSHRPRSRSRAAV